MHGFQQIWEANIQTFHLDGTKLEMVRSYKYLGFVITPSGEITTGLKDLRDRALKGFMKMRNDMGPSFNEDILGTLLLIESLIKTCTSICQRLLGLP